MAIVHLKMKDVLLKCRKAFDEGRLQNQQKDFEPNQGCFYTGPCAIGASVPYHIAHAWDNADTGGVSASFDLLVIDGLVSVESEEEWDDMSYLQRSHDEASPEVFEQDLIRLETKYDV